MVQRRVDRFGWPGSAGKDWLSKVGKARTVRHNNFKGENMSTDITKIDGTEIQYLQNTETKKERKTVVVDRELEKDLRKT